MRIVLSAILSMLLAIVTTFSNCTAVCAEKESVTVTDLGKRSVEAPLGPERIVCLSSGTLRLISMLGAANRVVGVEDFEKTFPAGRPYILANPDITKLPSIGPGGPGSINKEPDLEALLKVKPDVIFISYMEPQNADALQKKLGIPVVILSHGRFASFDELAYESLRVAGKILGLESRAEEIVSFIEKAKKDLNERTQGIDEASKPGVYAGAVGYKGVQGIESSDATYIPLEWNHARNLAKSASTKDHCVCRQRETVGLESRNYISGCRRPPTGESGLHKKTGILWRIEGIQGQKGIYSLSIQLLRHKYRNSNCRCIRCGKNPVSG